MRRPRGDFSACSARRCRASRYADHMATVEFQDALARLIALGAKRATAFMCAETHPEHCHRSFIADALAARGIEVLHLMGPQDVRAHVSA